MSQEKVKPCCVSEIHLPNVLAGARRLELCRRAGKRLLCFPGGGR